MPPKVSRLFPNWIQEFVNVLGKDSETPDSMITWTAISTIASALRRSVWIPEYMLAGNYRLYPNLYVMLVSPPGTCRKSTMLGMSDKLLSELSGVKVLPTTTSASYMFKKMASDNNHTGSILASEFGQFVSISQSDMYNLLIDLYDNRSKVDAGTHIHGELILENPCVNLLGATTPNWIANGMPVEAREGGFTSRTVFVYEEVPKMVKLLQDYSNDQDENRKRLDTFKGLVTALASDLAWIFYNIEGEFHFENRETHDRAEEWYQDYANAREVSSRMGHFRSRKHTNALKVAMCLSVSERSDRQISMENLEMAVKLVESVEEKLGVLFASSGANRLAGVANQVVQYIYDTMMANGKKPVNEDTLLSRFHGDLNSAEFDEVISTATRANMIKVSYISEGGAKVKRYSLNQSNPLVARLTGS